MHGCTKHFDSHFSRYCAENKMLQSQLNNYGDDLQNENSNNMENKTLWNLLHDCTIYGVSPQQLSDKLLNMSSVSEPLHWIYYFVGVKVLLELIKNGLLHLFIIYTYIARHNRLSYSCRRHVPIRLITMTRQNIHFAWNHRIGEVFRKSQVLLSY